MADPRLENLRIRTGIVKRLTREKVAYEKEAVTQREKLDRCKKEEVSEDLVVKKLEEGLQMTTGMIIDCQNRLLKAYTECQTILKTHLNLKETEEYASASRAMDDAREHLPYVESAPDDGIHQGSLTS